LYDAGSLLLAILPYLISFLAWSKTNSDVKLQSVHPLEPFESFFNRLIYFAMKTTPTSTPAGFADQSAVEDACLQPIS
jgi:hypothetical protein